MLFRSWLDNVHWINNDPLIPGAYQAKVRYRQTDQPCELHLDGDKFRANFTQPQRAVTPGQWACFYEGDICLGGGVITATNAVWT